MEYVLQTFDLTKKYKRQLAVNEANMNIARGDIYGFVGENGSGKTTIIRLITGLIFASSGSFKLFGVDNTDKDITAARRRVGAIVETPSIYQNMSARDNLKMQCTILGIGDEEKVLETLKTVGLEELYNDKKHVSNFSLGMRQRMGIAMALLGDPEFIILDEPMNGLDPAGIVEVRELILKLNREKGITFLISSHILTELSLVATKYGIISKGKIIREITSEQLHNECGKWTVLKAEDSVSLLGLLKEKFPQYPAEMENDAVKIVGDIDLNGVLSEIVDSKNRILSVNCNEMGFEDYYLSVVGGGKNE